MQAEDLLEPAKLFKSTIKPMHRENAEEFFEQLVADSNLDVELNKLTNKKIREKGKQIDNHSKALKKKRALKGFSIFLTIVGFAAAIILIIMAIKAGSGEDNTLKIIIACVSAVIAIVFIFVAIKASKAIKKLTQDVDALEKMRNSLITEAYGQMEELNNSFDWHIPAKLFTKTIPLIQLDPYFDETKYQMLHEKYDFNGNPEANISTVFVQSGSILGNPFLIEKNYIQEMRNVTYTGSITISWTTTYKDSEGHVHTQTHTEILTASVEKPAPYYYYDTMLVYGNDAAANLSFSRVPSNANKMNEKQLQKFIDSYDAKLDKMTQKSISKGTNFQRLGNNEFEALFNALDRNNNIEFRLLFTPLAQKNMVNLITSKEPYGDDFYFVKRKNLNYIKSIHSQNTDFTGDPEIFSNYYDYEASKKFFLDYNDAYMQSLYYDLAPIMSIPLYQQHAAQEYIYKGTLTRNITEMETEVMANSFDPLDFKPADAVTDVILKTELVSKQNEADVNRVYAHSFRSIRHVDYFSKLGGDGSMHDIPVEWIEYIPVTKTSTIVVQNPQATRKEYRNNTNNETFKQFLSRFTSNNDMIYKKGFISFLGLDNVGSYNGNELNKILKKGDK